MRDAFLRLILGPDMSAAVFVGVLGSVLVGFSSNVPSKAWHVGLKAWTWGSLGDEPERFFYRLVSYG